MVVDRVVAKAIVPLRELGDRKRSCGITAGSGCPSIYTRVRGIYTRRMAKHLVDIDEDALDGARRELGTRTIKDTVNLALRRVAPQRRDDVKRQLDVLARADLVPREQAWR